MKTLFTLPFNGICILICIISLSQEINAQTNLSFEYRPRLILDRGYKTPKPSDASFVAYTTQRSRIGLDYKKEKIEVHFSIQDIRYWGGEGIYNTQGVYGDGNSLELYQAWVRLLMNNVWALKVGRQSFNYDDQRLLSARNWNDHQVSYDALLLQYKNKASRTDIGVSWNSDNSRNNLLPSQKLKTLNFIRYETLISGNKISLQTLVTGKTRNDTSDAIALKNTLSAYFERKTENIDYQLSGHYQTHLNKISQSINAYCLSARLKYRLPGNKTILEAGIDHLSGQSESESGKTDRRFDILYGGRHRFYGYMDFYSKLPQQGLNDFMLRTSHPISTNLTLQLDLHHFRLASSLPKSAEGNSYKSDLGYEADLVIKWKPLPECLLETGYCFYFDSPAFEAVTATESQNSSAPVFIYVMLSLKLEALNPNL